MKNQYNEKGQKHGYWEEHYNNGQLYYKCNYVNGEYHGESIWFWFSGDFSEKCNNINGKNNGLHLRFFKNKIERIKFFL